MQLVKRRLPRRFEPVDFSRFLRPAVAIFYVCFFPTNGLLSLAFTYEQVSLTFAHAGKPLLTLAEDLAMNRSSQSDQIRFGALLLTLVVCLQLDLQRGRTSAPKAFSKNEQSPSCQRHVNYFETARHGMYNEALTTFPLIITL